MIHLSSLSFHFDSIEDRIRMIGNLSNDQQRVDFWMTRRLVLRILDASPQLIQKTSVAVSQAPAEHQAAMAQFEHDKAKQEPVEREKDQDHSTHDAILLRRMDISYREDRFHLVFFIDDGKEPYASSVLTHQEIHQILYWMHKGALGLEWGVDPILFDQDAQHTTTLQ